MIDLDGPTERLAKSWWEVDEFRDNSTPDGWREYYGRAHMALYKRSVDVDLETNREKEEKRFYAAIFAVCCLTDISATRMRYVMSKAVRAAAGVKKGS